MFSISSNRSCLFSNICSPFTDVLMSWLFTALSVSDIFWCLVHKQVSLVINDVRSTCFGRILQNEVNDNFIPGFSLTSWYNVDKYPVRILFWLLSQTIHLTRSAFSGMFLELSSLSMNSITFFLCLATSRKRLILVTIILLLVIFESLFLLISFSSPSFLSNLYFLLSVLPQDFVISSSYEWLICDLQVWSLHI